VTARGVARVGPVAVAVLVVVVGVVVVVHGVRVAVRVASGRDGVFDAMEFTHRRQGRADHHAKHQQRQEGVAEAAAVATESGHGRRSLLAPRQPRQTAAVQSQGLSEQEYDRTVTRRHTRRRCIVLMTLLCLLFQQVAIAAYACTMVRMPPDPVALSEDCGSMAMGQVVEAPALCAKHCVPEQSVVPDSPVVSVPPLALPPPAFALTATAPITAILAVAGPPSRHAGPPPRLRFCSLLI